ncbi:MAG: signal peptidase I [Parcubacteria group bacterium]|nr:signal peptidase I [Parcubacteria group bacterium]
MRAPVFSSIRKRTGRIMSALVLVLAFVAVLAFVFRNIISEESGGAPESERSADIAEFTVTGASMEPILFRGQIIRVDTAAYQRDPIKTGDMVVIKQPGDNGYLVKFVKAIPGDTLGLAEQPDGRSRVLVNGEALVNSEGEPYLLPENKTAMLRLYARDYGTIPDGAYLVLGNRPGGTDDSTVFGLIDAKRIKGKVLTSPLF